MLVFALDEVNEMTRGKGIILQRFKDGGLSDARVFAQGGRADVARCGRTDVHARWSELREWIGQRAQAGPAGAQGLPAIE